ncbi:MAG TPA: hypothetical protein QF753_15095 [Victivallales bacterium]|nr:hypothetical protein [Victivallales bacterium]
MDSLYIEGCIHSARNSIKELKNIKWSFSHSEIEKRMKNLKNLIDESYDFLKIKRR